MSDSESAGDQRYCDIIEVSEKVARAKLVDVFELSGGARPLIAIDLDDVLCQTTRCVAECVCRCSFMPLNLCLTSWTWAAQGIIAGLGRTCKSNISIVSPFRSPWSRCHHAHTHNLYWQTRLGIKYRSCPHESFKLCRSK
jgi:hypothetical protein